MATRNLGSVETGQDLGMISVQVLVQKSKHSSLTRIQNRNRLIDLSLQSLSVNFLHISLHYWSREVVLRNRDLECFQSEVSNQLQILLHVEKNI